MLENDKIIDMDRILVLTDDDFHGIYDPLRAGEGLPLPARHRQEHPAHALEYHAPRLHRPIQ